MATEKKQRAYGLDLVRAMAGILVLSVHFFMNNGFYYETVSGKSMLAACMVRMLCMTCVPLFLVLTGYLCVNRKWGKGYYRKLLPILLTYLAAGTVCLVFRVHWMGEDIAVREMLRQMLSFSASPYGWYIEMYVGLFLLSPFFNAAWHSLDDGGKKALTVTLVCLTAVPTVLGPWKMLLSQWWVGIYPLTYYAAGAWLREHPIRIKSWKLFLCWLAVAGVMGARGYAKSVGGPYASTAADQWYSLSILIQAVCIFSCLIQCTGEHVPRAVRWCVNRVARLSLGMYLVSYAVDQLVYPVLAQAVPSPHLRIWWMPVTVLATVLGSLLLAQPIDWAVGALLKLVPAGKPEGAEKESEG